MVQEPLRWLAKLLLRMQNILLFLLCILLFKRRYKSDDVRKIMIMRVAALGDFLFAVPSMIALRRRFPNVTIVLLTTPTTNTNYNKAVQNYVGDSETLPWLDFVIPTIIDEAFCFSVNARSLHKDVRERVRKFNPDVTIILSHPGDPAFGLMKKLFFLKLLGVRSDVCGWRIRSSNKFLREAQYKAGLFEHKIMGPLRAISESPLMLPIENIRIEFPLNIKQCNEHWADNFLREKGWEEIPVVAVVPGSIQPHKRWPAEKFVLLCQDLMRIYGVKLVIIGTKGDKDIGKRIREEVSKEIENLAGEVSIQQSAALLKRCVLLVGNDGGAMHLGAAINCPCVSIIPGIEYPGSIEPWGNEELAVRHFVSCAPCYSFTHCPQGHNRCMVDLPLEKVFAQCAKILDRVLSHYS